jgi:hypothetical protein
MFQWWILAASPDPYYCLTKLLELIWYAMLDDEIDDDLCTNDGGNAQLICHVCVASSPV